MRRPVISSKRSRTRLALAEAEDHRGERAELHAAGREGDQVGGDPVELHHHHADDRGPLGDLVGDAEQLLDGEAVRRLVEERRQVVHARHERDALGPRCGTRGSSRCRCAGSRCRTRASVTVSPSSSRISRSTPCVDGCCGPMLTTTRSCAVLRDALDDVVPVLAGDGVDACPRWSARLRRERRQRRLGRRRCRCPRTRRWSVIRSTPSAASGGGISAPLYSTGMPPSG